MTKKRIGMGMKPREGALSTQEGQSEVSNDDQKGVSDVTLGGTGFSGVVTQIPETESEAAEKAAENEPIVAENAVSDPLQEALAASEEPYDPKWMFGPKKTVEPLSEDRLTQLAEKMIPELGLEVDGIQFFTKDGTPLTGIISKEEAAKWMAPPLIQVDIDNLDLSRLKDVYPGQKISYEPRPLATLVPPLDGKTFPLAQVELGELPTGELRHTVRVAEAYVEGAKQQAEADGMSLEDWLSLYLNIYLEQFWYANGPK